MVSARIQDLLASQDEDDDDDGSILFPGARGLAKLGDLLFIDLNANGQIDFRNDITIFNFFNEEGSNFDQVGNLSGEEIVEFFDNLPPELQEVGNFVFLPSEGEVLNGVQNFIFAEEDEQNLLLEGGDQGDLIVGNDTDNILIGNGGNDELFDQGGNDFITANDGNDYLDGGSGNDTLYGGEGNDELLGGDEDDLLFGDQGFDTLYGDDGNDTLYGGEDNDLLQGEEGDDVLFGGLGRDTLEGAEGNDLLYGGQGNDLLRGDRGNDTLVSESGADSLFGGAGDDLYILNAATSGGSIIEDDGGTDGLIIEGQPLVIGLNPGQIGVTRGGELNSELLVDLNADGNFNLAADLRIVDFFNNLDPGTGFIETVGNLRGEDILQAFPVIGTPQNDNLIGSQQDDEFDGLPGNDTLNGNAGNDTLIGGSDDDYLQGDNTQLISDPEGLIFQGTPVGNDSLVGEDGNDTLFGGAGNDTVDGGDGQDFADYENALDGVSVNLNNGTASDGLDGTDTLVSIENIQGSNLNDTLIGNAGDNVLDGTVGGADILQGGLGDDTYKLNAQASGGSQIIDEGGEDILILTNYDSDEINLERQGTTAIINLNPNGEINPNQVISILNYYASDVGDEPGIGFIEKIQNEEQQELSTTTSNVGTRSFLGLTFDDFLTFGEILGM